MTARAIAFEKLSEKLSREPRVWCVTGVAGFIGSHLVEKLLSLGQHVTGVDDFSTGHRKNLSNVEQIVGPERWKRFRFIEGDVSSPEVCIEACRDADFVLHQAALGSVPRSIVDPLATHKANVDGFVTMLTAAKNNGVRGFVYASSSSVYGDDAELPKREERIGNCLSPYAATKRINELYADNFRRVYGQRSLGLRYFNVFGPRQDPQGAYAAVIPRWIHQLLTGTPCTIFGDGTTSRDFCYVDNVVQANILAAAASADSDEFPLAVNVAASHRTSLRQLYSYLAESISALSGRDVPREPVFAPEREGDIRHSLADLETVRRVLQYSPVVDVQEGIRRTVEWFWEHRSAA